MKKRYLKPTVAVELFALTQTIASCVGIKITKTGPSNGPADVLADPDSTNAMKSWAYYGGFLSNADGCIIEMNGAMDPDGSCYHTNVNAAFNS